MQYTPKSVNFHITERCNYQCKFCFAKYSEFSQELPLSDAKRLIFELANAGCEKINFAGGEPTIIRILPELIIHAKKVGLFVSLISNGTGITPSLIKKVANSIDIIGLSIDSSSNTTEFRLGRGISRPHIELIQKAAKLIHSHNIKLKINTTITPLNWQDDMNDLISQLNPFRWKVFQVHPIQGINDRFFEEFGYLETKQFNHFMNRHQNLNPIGESTEIMNESYIMITPDGRFYQNSNNAYQYSERILDIGVENAFQQIQFSENKFLQRQGEYYVAIDQPTKEKIASQAHI